jgi:diadenosine tetraphosphate (Ap4A) HIT family hydrolase
MVGSEAPNCFICRKHAGLEQVPGGAIYQDDLLYAGHAQIRPGREAAYLGYLMVEPRRHAPGLGDLTSEARALGELAPAQPGAPPAWGRTHLRLCDRRCRSHFHLHLVLRYPGACKFWGRADEWPDAPGEGRDRRHLHAPERDLLAEDRG